MYYGKGWSVFGIGKGRWSKRQAKGKRKEEAGVQILLKTSRQTKKKKKNTAPLELVLFY
jgi:hypothetical protein